MTNCLRKRTGPPGDKTANRKRCDSISPNREGVSSMSSPAGGLHVMPARPITLVARGFSYAVRMTPQIPCVNCAKSCLPGNRASTRAEAAREPGDEVQPLASLNACSQTRTSASAGGQAETRTQDAFDIEKGSGDEQHMKECPTQNRTGKEGSTDRQRTNEAEGPLKVILKDIDLYAKPGEMLVIMGPSGSGKTTLLNSLAGRSPPTSRVVQDGSLLYLGLPPGEPLSSFSTYVMQKDKVPELLTVQEYVTFFSRLKMRDATDEERAERVEVVLRELGLWRSRFTRVGGSAKKGLSGGEIKRLALAVELLHNPSLIFLDEPTSGLDAALAFETMKLLLRLARHGGRTILCTIHQPRSQLFAMFDRLVLMFEGRIVFQGPARQCVSYFAKRGFHCPPQFNPADFILDLLTVTTLTATAPLVCPQSEGSLSAQSLLDAELKKVHTLEAQRLELLKQREPASVSANLDTSEGSECLDCRANGEADRQARSTPEGVDEEEKNRLTATLESVPEVAGARDGNDDEKETKTQNGSSPPLLYGHRHRGQDVGLSGRRRRGNDEEGTTAGRYPSGSSGEGRTGVSVLSIASAVPLEMATRDIDVLGVRDTMPSLQSEEAKDTHGPTHSRPPGGANVSGFLDAEEALGEIHRVLVDENDVKRLANSYASSPERAHVVETINEVLEAVTPDLVKSGGRTAVVKRLLRQRRWSDRGREVSVLVQMGFLNHFRNPMSSLVQLGLNIVLGIIFGGIFFNVPGHGMTSESGRNMLGCLFFLGSQLIFGPLDCLVLFCTDRELFNRDTANGNYTTSSFFVAKCLSNLPFEHIPLTCVTLIAYVMCGLHKGATHFFIYFFIGQLSIFSSTSLLGFISAASPHIGVAQAVAPIVLITVLLVTGYYIRADDIPAVIRWLKYVSPIHYSYGALAINQFPPDESWGEIANRELLDSYGSISSPDLGFYIGMLALLGCVFRILSFVCLKYLHRRIGLEA